MACGWARTKSSSRATPMRWRGTPRRSTSSSTRSPPRTTSTPTCSCCKLDGTLTLVGAPEQPLPVAAFNLLMPRRSFAGSGIGGIKETQEMLDFCAEHGIVSDIELIQDRPDQRGLRAHAEERRPLPLRDRHAVVEGLSTRGVVRSWFVVGGGGPHSNALPRRAPVTLPSAPASAWPNSPASLRSNRGVSPLRLACRYFESALAEVARSNEALLPRRRDPVVRCQLNRPDSPGRSCGSVRHHSHDHIRSPIKSPLQHLMHERHRNRSLAHCRRHPLDIPASHVAHREHTRPARLQQVRRAR